ncbi:hypothetical protein H1C71_004119 [Ictidomys tridecemlineatus]|nr:hypothetical protein H1C71_004119 [Ictidomys tridecemlineatus]
MINVIWDYKGALSALQGVEGYRLAVRSLALQLVNKDGSVSCFKIDLVIYPNLTITFWRPQQDDHCSEGCGSLAHRCPRSSDAERRPPLSSCGSSLLCEGLDLL